MLAVEVKNISKSFEEKKFFSKKKRSHTVLDNCTLDIEHGKIFGLAGLNGIGKTTLIKMILNLQVPDGGEITIFGKKNTDIQSRKDVCYLPEKFCPQQYLTGYEFLKIFLSFFDQKLDLASANEMAKKLDMNPEILKIVIKKYSKGMGQKLGLLSCLLSKAKLLILDEPMSGLDPKVRVLLKKLLLEYAGNGNTIFFSSHIIDDMEEICDKISVLNNGQIVFSGAPKELRANYPATSAEKSFLACINAKQ